MELKSRLLHLYERAYEEEQKFVAGLSDEERSATGTLELWSAKDLIAHCAAWKERVAQALTSAARGQFDLDIEPLDTFNARVFKENQNRSWPEVIAYSRRAYESLYEQTKELQDEVLRGSDLLPQMDKPVWRMLSGDGYSHPISHMAEYYDRRGDAAYANEIQEQVKVALEGIAIL